jgi:Zn-finger nucleic acid-binding protein
MNTESCGICGGDGRIANSFGLTDKCPTCRGTGRRGDAEPLMRDVTKTKPSHFKQPGKAAAAEKKQWPDTYEGVRLATEIQASTAITPDVKARLVRDVVDYEESHANCTQTFQKKIRKLLRVT